MDFTTLASGGLAGTHNNIDQMFRPLKTFKVPDQINPGSLIVKQNSTSIHKQTNCKSR